MAWAATLLGKEDITIVLTEQYSVMASNSSSAAARKSQVAVAIALTVCE